MVLRRKQAYDGTISVTELQKIESSRGKSWGGILGVCGDVLHSINPGLTRYPNTETKEESCWLVPPERTVLELCFMSIWFVAYLNTDNGLRQWPFWGQSQRTLPTESSVDRFLDVLLPFMCLCIVYFKSLGGWRKLIFLFQPCNIWYLLFFCHISTSKRR